jgi:hypothetical protein
VESTCRQRAGVLPAPFSLAYWGAHAVYFARRLVGDGLILGLVGLDLDPDKIAHSGQHVAIAGDIGPGGEGSMPGHVFGLGVGDREVVVDRVDDAIDAAAMAQSMVG